MWRKDAYGGAIAGVYDELYEDLFDVVGTVEFLRERARGGPALELAIGTGRIALPLAREGIEVHGIDIAPEMVDRLRAKPGGDDLRVAIGDFADVGIEGSYPLVYVVFNTFFALHSQDEQIRCLENVARHLTPEGVFVVEAFVPDVTRYVRHQNVEVSDVEVDRVVLHVARHDPMGQTIRAQLIVFGDGETKMYPIYMRYAYPPELDLMARLAGLELRERYGDWSGAPFTSQSAGHVSVYGLR